MSTNCNYNHAPFKVVQKTGTAETLRNEAGVELKRKTAFVKTYNEHNDVSNGNGDQVVQADERGPRKITDTTGPLPSPETPHFQNEGKCTTFLRKMSFICMRMKNQFHIKGWALNLILIQRPGGTRKWPIPGTFEVCEKFSSATWAFYRKGRYKAEGLIRGHPGLLRPPVRKAI